MWDLIFVGNISEDNIIINASNKSNKCIGGSAVYSSFASRISNEFLKIGIIGKCNGKYKNIIEQNKIDFLGKIVVDNTIFYIDEIKNTCEGENYNNVCYENSKKVKTRHLHISFRKGISVEQIIENELIEYDSLSVDVMIYSVNFFIPVLKKYSNKIDILFCNMDEYIMIKEYIDSKTIVVITNNSKPVTALAFNKIYMAEVDYIYNVLSTTGAGDSFIGGFLGRYLQEKNLEESIKSGIMISQKSILNIRTFNEQ